MWLFPKSGTASAEADRFRWHTRRQSVASFPAEERQLDANSLRERAFLSPAFRPLGERCNILMSCRFVTERAEIPFGSTGSDSAVGGHDLSEDRRFFGVSIIFTNPEVDDRPPRRAAMSLGSHTEDRMPTFMCSLNWTDQGIRSIKDAPKRAKAAQDLAKKVGVEIKQVYLTSGDSDLLVILDTPNGDNVAKFALALGSQGSVRTRTARIWPQSEFQKLISELP